MRYAILDNNDVIVSFTTSKKEGGIYVGDTPPALLKTKLDILKQNKLREVRQVFQSKIDTLSLNYTDYEKETFFSQQDEWKKYKNDATADTPIVDTLAQARGITREALFKKIESKVLYIISVQGEQNKLEDLIKNASTEADLLNVSF